VRRRLIIFSADVLQNETLALDDLAAVMLKARGESIGSDLEGEGAVIADMFGDALVISGLASGKEYGYLGDRGGILIGGAQAVSSCLGE
jgi:hypothetical protein